VAETRAKTRIIFHIERGRGGANSERLGRLARSGLARNLIRRYGRVGVIAIIGRPAWRGIFDHMF